MPEEERGDYFLALGAADTVYQWPILFVVMLIILPVRLKPDEIREKKAQGNVPPGAGTESGGGVD